MSVNIVPSALSMSQSLDSLKTVTPLTMHRITFTIDNISQWYSIMKEARSQFGKNWRGQPKIKRKLAAWRVTGPVRVWFDVPDPTFATWCAVKLGVSATEAANK